MFFFSSITAFLKFSGMNGNLFSFTVNFDQASGIDYLCLFSDISIGNAVIMLVLAQIDVIVLSHFMFSVIFDFEGFRRKFKKMFFLIGQELFFPTVILLLHTGLVVKLHILADCMV